jgi:UDP-2,4-diacetamido-2,4,6-trideoxy-beta-L-altropyranose hydrolase
MHVPCICVRADASRSIGSGHVMRCLVLADRLRLATGARIAFLCRELEGNLIAYIRARGYEVGVLPGEAASPAAEAEWTIEWLATRNGRRRPDWLIVDHYGLDWRYEQHVRPHVQQLMVIDDLANRAHDCDVLLDANLGPEQRYFHLVGPGTRLLLGPQYALLRKEFAALRPRVRRDGRARQLLVSFGGVDPSGETAKTLDALAQLAEHDWTATVVAGQSNPRARLLEQRCAGMQNVRFIMHTEQMAQLMLEADLAIGAGGSSTWERCCLGLPSLVITVAGNQEALTEAAASAGVVRWLGPSSAVGPGHIRDAVLTLGRNPAEMHQMSARAMGLVDGRGAERIAKELVR